MTLPFSGGLSNVNVYLPEPGGFSVAVTLGAVPDPFGRWVELGRLGPVLVLFVPELDVASGGSEIGTYRVTGIV